MRTIPRTPTATEAPTRPADPTAPTAPTAPTVPTAPATTGAAAPTTARTWPGAAIMDEAATAGVLHAVWSGDPAVIAPAPPGSGKTRLVALLAATLATRAGLRVGIAAQTRDQAAEVARRLGSLDCPVRLAWPAKIPHPDLGPGPSAVARGRDLRFPATGGGVITATTARWTYADPDALGCDVMIVDEAWQATYADLAALGAFTGQVVCVGDPGQIDPVVTGVTRRWTGSPTAPHLPAPMALLAAHGEAVNVVHLRHTWRLGPLTTALIQPAFYPDLPFTTRRPPEHLSAPDGAVLPEITHQQVPSTAGPSDPALVHACADQVRRILGTTLTTGDGTRPTAATDLAVVTAHVSQAAAVRALLADHPQVLVGTANQVQGAERAAVVVAHPLAGYRDLSPFATDTGRTCVMLSRHRAHLSVVTDAATPAVLSAAEDTPAVRLQRHLLDAVLAAPALA